MAKVAKSCSFSKAIISREADGSYSITEYDKDDTREYSLSEILDAFENVEVSLSIKQESPLRQRDVSVMSDADGDEDV